MRMDRERLEMREKMESNDSSTDHNSIPAMASDAADFNTRA